MAQSNPALSDPAEAPGSPEPPIDDAAWREVVQLLRRAAQLATDADSERFMEAAWQACLDVSPGLREELVEKELRAQLKKLRKRGLVASA